MNGMHPPGAGLSMGRAGSTRALEFSGYELKSQTTLQAPATSIDFSDMVALRDEAIELLAFLKGRPGAGSDPIALRFNGSAANITAMSTRTQAAGVDHVVGTNDLGTLFRSGGGVVRPVTLVRVLLDLDPTGPAGFFYGNFWSCTFHDGGTQEIRHGGVLRVTNDANIVSLGFESALGFTTLSRFEVRRLRGRRELQ